MSWNFSNDVPIYLQIMEHFKVQIASGKLEVGDKIPPVRELALEAGVNPNTMQKALSELEREGYLESQRTSGRFVADRGKQIDRLKQDMALELMCSLCCQTGEGIGDTDFGYTLSLISGKYKLVIMYWLANHKEVMRYSEIKRCMGNISHKTLSATLKEMEADRLIVRKEYPQIPPKVEYSLSERGKSLVPVLVAMCKWGGEHRDDK